jgi:hypothetical protein
LSFSDPNISRRALLLGGLSAAGSLSALGGLGPLQRLARAAEGTLADEHYYIFCYFNGGWDILLGLDPRDPTAFHADNIQNTLIYPGYELLEATDGQLVQAGDITFGPAIGGLAAHADKLSIVRGMSMDTLTHSAGMRRFLTGKPPSGLQARGSSAATWLASLLGEGDPIPNLAVRVESYNDSLPSYASGLSVTSVGDLIRALQASGKQITAIERQQIDELLSQQTHCPGALVSPFLQNTEVARRRAHEMVAKQLDSLFSFMDDEWAPLRELYGIQNASQATSSAQAQAALAAQAIKGGVSRVVSIEVTRGLDTHYDNWVDDQPERQMEGFDVVASLLTDLASSQYKGTSDSWLDHTTIVGFSEFSRTALINDFTGRDHSLTNACFLAGAGIKGGQVIGRSSNVGMMPVPLDLASGVDDPSGDIVRPEHIIQALFHDIGVTDDPADLRVDPLMPLLKNA